MPRATVYGLIGVEHTDTGAHWITVAPDFMTGCKCDWLTGARRVIDSGLRSSRLGDRRALRSGFQLAYQRQHVMTEIGDFFLEMQER